MKEKQYKINVAGIGDTVQILVELEVIIQSIVLKSRNIDNIAGTYGDSIVCVISEMEEE